MSDDKDKTGDPLYDELGEAHDRGYENGRRFTLAHIIQRCLQDLGYEGTPADIGIKLASEREEALAALRRVCGEYGDNDWSEDVHLADIIENHLGKHLDAKES